MYTFCNMRDARIIVTGDSLRFPHDGPGGAPCDAVELVASSIGMPWDDVTHLRRASQEDVQRLQNMPRYVAGIGLEHAADLLPSATELIVFDIPRLRLKRQRYGEQIAAVLSEARSRGIAHHYFSDASEFRSKYLGSLQT